MISDELLIQFNSPTGALGCTVKPLPGGDWNAGMGRHLLQGGQVVRTNRLLDPARPEFRDGPGDLKWK